MEINFNLDTFVSPHQAPALIKGITTKNGVSISCEVRAYSRLTGALLSKAYSNSSGKYILFGKHSQPNYVIATDPLNQYNIAAQDNVK